MHKTLGRFIIEVRATVFRRYTNKITSKPLECIFLAATILFTKDTGQFRVAYIRLKHTEKKVP